MAWKAALSLALKDSNLRNHHPQGELRKALTRAFGWGCSTSGVEQAFSGIRALTNSKGSMTEIALAMKFFFLAPNISVKLKMRNWPEQRLFFGQSSLVL